MASANWRGIVGVVKPTYESGSLVEFIRLLPEGVGVIPVYAGIKQHTERGYLDALETYHERVAELAAIGVDLMHPEGGPPFMVRGYKSEQEIVKQWEEKYKMPIFTSGMTQAAALRALESRDSSAALTIGITSSTIFSRAIFPMPDSRCSQWKAWTLHLEKRKTCRVKPSTTTSSDRFSSIQTPRAFICSAPAHGALSTLCRQRKILASRSSIPSPHGSGTCRSSSGSINRFRAPGIS